MAISTLSNIIAAIGVGARPNLFRVSFAGGIDASATSDISFLVKSAALPASTVGLIEVPHVAGRRLKIPGDRTFADWTITVLSDSALAARAVFEDYQELFVSSDQNTLLTVGNRATTRTTVTVEQLAADAAGTTIRTYTLNNAFVTDISAMDLSYDTTDAIEEFTVTFTYDYFNVA
jgi:hypothetical protein